MAYGSGYAGGYADAVDNSTLAGSAALAITTSADLTSYMVIAGSAAIAINAPVANLQVGAIMALAGQADLAISTSGTMTFVLMDLAGTAAIVITTADAETQMVMIWGGTAHLAIQCSGTLKLNRPPTPPPAKIQQAIVKRRSIVMPTPILEAWSGRPS